MTESTRRSVKSAKLRRAALAEIMGGSCYKCGSTEKLEFHHVQDRDWVAKKLNRWMRVKMYERDYFQGILVLLCHECHKEIG
jgi:hypothetical protein